MTTKLQISKDLALPREVITETLGVLAVRGAGKTNTCRVLAEEMFDAGLPFVAIDPVGSWRGLRSSRDGKGPGLPIPIFGGKWGDVPLERGGGELVADLVVDQRLSCVLDLSTFDSEASKKTFLLDFARRLYRRNEEPLHLFLEEADDYIPQRPMRDEAQLLRAWENIVRRGRARGLGITLITQRSASINKSVLTQVQTLIAMRTTGPQDRAAIEDWLKYHAQSREILESLPKLDAGEAWVWSPTFLHKTVRTRFRLSRTFDAGATPKMGKGSKAAATLADVDLGDLSKRMAAVIERAKQDDPRALRRRIVELEKELAKKPAAAPPQIVEQPVFDRHGIDELRELLRKHVEGSEISLKHLHAKVDRGLEEYAERCNAAAVTGQQGVTRLPRAAIVHRDTKPPIRETKPARRETNGAGGVPELGNTGLRRMMIALAQHPNGLSDSQIAILTGIARTGGTFRTYVGAGKTNGWLEGDSNRRALTAEGRKALGAAYEALPTGEALLEYWLGRLGDSGASRMLRAIADAYPEPITRVQLAERTNIALGGGTFRTYLGKLKTLELVDGRSELVLSEELA